MKLIILCGGSGTRLQDYSFPKPLNMIHGKPSISYCLQNLPESIKELYFIVAPHLYDYHFEEIVTNQFKSKHCHFIPLPYFTRGPIESAWLGTTLFQDDESIVFLDNDVLYTFPSDFFTNYDTAFLGYSVDHTGSEAYSYITLHDNTVSMIREKKRISDHFCCGVYGFSSIHQFRKLAEPLIPSVTSELYMSLLFQSMIKQSIPIKGIEFPSPILHIGSLKELQNSWTYIKRPSMRICFDLDNTLVTYPVVSGDYRTVKPIPKMIQLAQQMKKEGHTIIIHTARRMATHHSNVGAVTKDIGRITFDTLDAFNIPYDELLFGKPIADMYIDDRAVNPYRHDLQCMGYLYNDIEIPINSLPPNKYNTVHIDNNYIVKTGPKSIIEGEVYYYQHVPSLPYFPKLIHIVSVHDTVQIHMEYIKNIPFATLYQSESLTETHLDLVFEFMSILHHLPSPPSHLLPTKEDIISNYKDKLLVRFTKQEDYPFDDAKKYQDTCLSQLDIYLEQPITIVPYIHGDLWFSNMLLTYQHELKVIDMKGKVHTTFTTGGDPMYDYAKLYQSVLGYDAVLYNTSVSESYKQRIKSYVEVYFKKQSISIVHVRSVAISLMMGTMHAIPLLETKQRVWKWLTELIHEQTV
jgi:capsule biosynthesis phosphatase